MLILRFGFVLTASLVGVALAAPVPPEKQKPLSYHPIQKGTKWVYQWEGGDREATDVITAVEDDDGAKVIRVDRLIKLVNVAGEMHDDTVSIWTLLVSEKGLFQLKSGVDEIDTPPCLLKLPPKQGEKWEVNYVHPRRGKRIKGLVTVVGREKVEVPAGTYTAVRVDWDYTFDGAGERLSYWFAPGVGIVKKQGPNLDDELVLKSFILGK